MLTNCAKSCTAGFFLRIWRESERWTVDMHAVPIIIIADFIDRRFEAVRTVRWQPAIHLIEDSGSWILPS